MFKRRVRALARYPVDFADPEWIAYSDAPPAVADRVCYRLMLDSCREDWEKTRDPQALLSADTWCAMHRQGRPFWLRDATGVVFLQQRGPGHLQRYKDDVNHRARWALVKRLKHVDKLSWENARAEASERLAGSDAHGEPPTMKYSYELIERRLKVRTAEKALSDWLEAQRPPERWVRIPESKIKRLTKAEIKRLAKSGPRSG
jgi:hypothetical protein